MLLSTLSVLAVETSLTTLAYGQEENTTDHVPKFFAIQHAQSGSLSEINETAYSLELNDVSDKTILFSDRQDRIVTSISTSGFIGNWSVGEDSFKVDAPNAVLVVDEKEVKQDEIIIELFNPTYEKDSKMLKYDFVLLNTTTSIDSFDFELSTLLIDVTQVGDTISNLSKVNSMKNNSVRGK